MLHVHALWGAGGPVPREGKPRPRGTFKVMPPNKSADARRPRAQTLSRRPARSCPLAAVGHGGSLASRGCLFVRRTRTSTVARGRRRRRRARTARTTTSRAPSRRAARRRAGSTGTGRPRAGSSSWSGTTPPSATELRPRPPRLPPTCGPLPPASSPKGPRCTNHSGQ